MNIKLLTVQHLEFGSLKGDCIGSSEPAHVKMPHCWKSCVATGFVRTDPSPFVIFSGVQSYQIQTSSGLGSSEYQESTETYSQPYPGSGSTEEPKHPYPSPGSTKDHQPYPGSGSAEEINHPNPSPGSAKAYSHPYPSSGSREESKHPIPSPGSAKAYNHTCPICLKSFRTRSHLNRHSLIHTGAKPYACDICGKCFNQKSSVKSHKLIHIKEKIGDVINKSSYM